MPNQPFRAYGEACLWIEDPESIGLRFAGLSHDLSRRIQHTGWYLDPEGAFETVSGVVYRLPAKRGRERFMYGYADPYNCDRDGRGPACLALTVADDETDAARWGDAMAERMAEQERDYQAAWQLGTDAREIWRDVADAGRAYVSAIRNLRALLPRRHAGLATFGVNARTEILDAVASARTACEEWNEARERRDAHTSEHHYGWTEETRSAFREGYQNA